MKIHKTIHFWNPYDKTNTLMLFSQKSDHVLIFDHVEISRAMAAILEIQYVAYPKNVAYALFTLSAKSQTLTNTAQSCHFLVLSCPSKSMKPAYDHQFRFICDFLNNK